MLLPFVHRRHVRRSWSSPLLAACLLIIAGAGTPFIYGASERPQAATAERVLPIAPPPHALPSEEQSAGVKQFSFIVYGDTRGRRDGVALQYEHSLVIDGMLAEIKRRRNTPFPVRFVLQSGDAVTNGVDAHQWNVSYVPLVSRLTTEGDVSYFLAPGNHDVYNRRLGLPNVLSAMSALMPVNGSPRRLDDYATYSFAYGNTFVLALDSNIAGDDKQFNWTKSQLEGLDRGRYVNVLAFFHSPPYSSGPHGGAHVEEETAQVRDRYMPLFRQHHVRALFCGHDHLFEHWIERYSDSSGAHRMDTIVTGGGGASLYPYTGEPDLRDYVKAGASSVKVEHLVKPNVDPGQNPYHFVVVRVDGNSLDVEVIGVDFGRNFQPYRSNKMSLMEGSSSER